MDTSSSLLSSATTDEDKKPELKKEPKEEDEGSGSAAANSSPANTQSKKKSKRWHLGFTPLLVGLTATTGICVKCLHFLCQCDSIIPFHLLSHSYLFSLSSLMFPSL